jgi:hypothetical protein
MADQSIHPRVSGGRTTSAKVNTCANSSLTKRMTRQLAGIEKHLEQHPRDTLSQQRVSTIKSILSAQPAAIKQAAV